MLRSLASVSRLAAFAMVLLVALSGRGNALEPLAPPTGPVILTVSGLLQVSNSADGAAFDESALRALGEETLQTSTPWTDGTPTFRGVRLSSLAARLGLDGTTITAVALNDYSATIPFSDVERYDPILAYEMDGQRLKVRDKGPIWIVYPRDDHSELQGDRYNDRWVWQLRGLEIE